ncbi:cyclin-dependent kinase inhibitor 5-like [Andrographis paniculata]|uniref:cyclin-dependent kinase inhibitor 5-like n=1 Tax=Andrographis paniculata TaxID=175694 RepID=UPI0021E7101D|nr:cyclin-dependent kinase inhibitor 5-like [Andrographis paniculata]
MGKCTRKLRASGDVSSMDVSPSSLGVRTRARILALQQHQAASSADASPQSPKPDYLELRSRRLEKLPVLGKYFRNSRNASASEQSAARGNEENPKIENLPEKPYTGSVFEGRNGVFEDGDSEVEVSFGENNLEMDVRERTTRESTPCSSIGTVATMPGSSTKRKTPALANQRFRDTLRNISIADEIEAFFALAEQPQQRNFIEKYNFDILNDMPLPGRYEWIKATPCIE